MSVGVSVKSVKEEELPPLADQLDSALLAKCRTHRNTGVADNPPADSAVHQEHPRDRRVTANTAETQPQNQSDAAGDAEAARRAWASATIGWDRWFRHFQESAVQHPLEFGDSPQQLLAREIREIAKEKAKHKVGDDKNEVCSNETLGSDDALQAYRSQVHALQAEFQKVRNRKTVPISSIRVGDSIYPFRDPPIDGWYSPDTAGFCVKSVGPEIVGCGRTLPEAQRDWEVKVHIAFQQLVGKIAAEMTPDERKLWRRLQQVIDVPEHFRQTPFYFRNVGRVTQQEPPFQPPYRITWLDGEETDDLGVDQLPPDFLSLSPGQWFEATVEFDRQSNQIRRIVHILPTAPPEEMSADEQIRFFNELPTTADLPSGRWDDI